MMDITDNLRLRIQTSKNETFIAFVDDAHKARYDDIGALYYVVAVVLIYALSIVMMIASHIRKNKQDNQLRAYLKEMALLRKKDRREKILEKMTDLASKARPGSFSKKNKTKDKEKETSLIEEKKLQEYGQQAMETDEESREMLLSKNSNSDNDDSVFQLPSDFCIDMTKVENPTPKPTPKLTPKLTPKSETRSMFKIQVINENVPL